jgi:iron complex outermembrane receptor protein
MSSPPRRTHSTAIDGRPASGHDLKPHIWRALLVWLGLLAVPPPGYAQTKPRDLANATIEELMNITITSASRKEQPVDETPAAVFVLTQEDIRRSGLRTLPELFRLVPGVQVARINSSNWAVTIRGFNNQFANKLLVLIDGRSVYMQNFSGVYWDGEDMALDDIDRIEVIRGPGGAVWGANAVNGVINIVTKTAGDTQGAFVRLGSGTLDPLRATARYGGLLGSAAYRVYAQWTDHGETRLKSGMAARDSWQSLTTGARVDWTRGTDEWTVDASVRAGDGHPLFHFIGSATPGVAPLTDKPGSFRNGHVIGRWTRRADNGSTLQVQSVVAISRHAQNVTDDVTDNENSFDTQLQYQTRVGARHDLVTGGGYRFIDSTTTSQSFAIWLTPPDKRGTIVNLFAQDEITLTDRLRLTLGSKLERDTVSGWGVQPTARAMWQPAPDHHLWFAASRALRTPSNTDLALRVNVAVVPGAGAPLVIGFMGNPNYQVEEFQDVEAGYRLQVADALSIDVTGFRGHFTQLPTYEPLAPVFEGTPGAPHLFLGSRLENLQRADTAGVEVSARFAPVPAWRLDASYSSFHLSPHPDPSSRDPTAATFDGNAPSHQWQLHSSVRLGLRTEVDMGVFHTGALRALGVPAYTRADARVEIRLTDELSVVGAARNLLDPSHPEFSTGTVVSTQIPRSADVQLVWRFSR